MVLWLYSNFLQYNNINTSFKAKVGLAACHQNFDLNRRMKKVNVTDREKR